MYRREFAPEQRPHCDRSARVATPVVLALLGSSTLFLLTATRAEDGASSAIERRARTAAARHAEDAELATAPRSTNEGTESARRALTVELVDRAPASPAAPLDALSRTAGCTRIRVVDAAGVPVADAALEVWRDRVTAEAATADESVYGRSDASGMFVVDGAWTRLTAVAWADGSTSQLVTRDSFAAELEIALAPSRCMHGVVRDGVSGLPIAGAEICVWTHARGDSVQSAGDGTFVHPRLPASGPRQQVRASAPGYAPYVALVECDAFDGTRTWSGPDADARVHGRDADARVEFALWPEARIHGRVLGPGGEPITGARVRAQGYALLISGAATPDSAETCTRADGSYQLAGLRPDIAHAVFVEAAPFAAQLFELASGAEHALDVRMDLGAALSGQILDPAGLPAEGLHVELRRLDAPKAAAGGPASAPPRSLGRRDSRTADFAGYFEFEGLGTHRYQLRVLRGQTPLHVQDFVPEQGERIALPPLTLDCRWLTLRGTVDPGHAEIRVTSSRVEAWREIPLGSVHVDGDGSFRIAGLDARAPYELRWYAGDDEGRMLGVTRSWAHETVRLSPLGPSE